jgi:hypothetical protein
MSIVYFKFRAQLAYETVVFDGHFISVGELKRLICQKKSLGDAVNELSLSDPKNGTEFTDDATQIPKGTHVILRRVPQTKSRVIVAASVPLPPSQQRLSPPSYTAVDQTAGQVEATTQQADDFGEDPFTQNAANLMQEQAAARSLALVAGAAPGSSVARPGWGRGGAPSGGRGRGRGPAPSYVCRRCGESGKHWEKDCSTIGDPAFDYKTVRMPTGIPVTKLQRNADGSLVLPTGEMGELAPNRAAFQEQLALMAGAVQPPPSAVAAEAPMPSSQPLSLLAPKPGCVNEKKQDASSTVVPPSSRDVASTNANEDKEPPNPEADLFGDDEHSTAIPIVLESSGHEWHQPAPQEIQVDGAETHKKASPDLEAEELWELFHAMKDLMPSGTTVKLWVEAFGAGRPLTSSEYLAFQKEHLKEFSVKRSRGHTRHKQTKDNEYQKARPQTTRNRESGRSRSPSSFGSPRKSAEDVRANLKAKVRISTYLEECNKS